MVVIGINSSHLSTACLLKDGVILACISEERLTRIKNQAGLPILAVKECLKITNLTIDAVDYLTLNFSDPKYHTGFTVFRHIEKNPKAEKFKDKTILFLQKIKELALLYIPGTKVLIIKILPLLYKVFLDWKVKRKLYQKIEKELGITADKIILVNHHTAHTLSAYFSSPFRKNEKVLAFSLDAMGDGLCATVNVIKDGKIKTIAKTGVGNSIGDLYAQTTRYLGMTMGEHEYKVMGLAPYSHEKYYCTLLNQLRELIWVNPDLTFSSKYYSQIFYKILPKLYRNYRFDIISAALQRFTEDLICEWVRLAIRKTGISDIVCAGGVFMNVKANQKILELKEVKSLYITPSSGDESSCIGAACFAFLNFTKSFNPLPTIKPLKELYLGGEFSNREIELVLKRSKYKKHRIVIPKNIEIAVAKLLSKGEIVARFAGRMEFGARALGNRSILVDPSRLDVIYKINEQIKSRDFWMPFAPSILDVDESKYIINPKKMEAPYMVITFNSTDEGKKRLAAAMHQYDHTMRPQIVYKEWNPSFYKLIEEFKKITGIGAVLNTSFNLHGFPIVYTPKYALYVFENSALKNLALGPYLIQKS